MNVTIIIALVIMTIATLVSAVGVLMSDYLCSTGNPCNKCDYGSDCLYKRCPVHTCLLVSLIGLAISLGIFKVFYIGG